MLKSTGRITRGNSNMEKFRRNYFWIAFFAILFGLTVRFPTLSYDSELWAEQATNYLEFAITKSFWENILSTDAGYLVLLPRVIAYCTYKLFPLFWYPYITNFIALAFIAFSLSFICLKEYRGIIPSDDFRLLLSILFGLFLVPFYENCTYVNFSYHGILICLLMLFYPLDSLSKIKLVLLSIFVAILSVNKIHFILLVPLYICFTVYYFRRKELSFFIRLFYLPALLGITLQLVNFVSILHSDSFVSERIGRPLGYLVSQEWKALLTYIQSFVPFAPFYFALLLFFFSIFAVYYLWKTKSVNEKKIIFIICLNYVALSFVCISALAHGLPAFQFDKINYVAVNRVSFLTLNLVFLFICVVFYYLINCRKSASENTLLLLIFLLPFSGGVYSIVNDQSSVYSINNMKKGGQSDWKRYAKLTKDNFYYIPVNPDLTSFNIFWALSKGVSPVNLGPVVKNGEFFPADRNSRLYGLLYNSDKRLSVKVVGKDGKLSTQAKTLTRGEKLMKLIKFDNPVENIEKIIFIDSKTGEITKENPHVVLLEIKR